MSEIISVAELNSRVKELFAKTPTLNDIWVSGEISNLKKYPSGYYFVLKDTASEIHAVMFKSARARIDFEPQENMKVTVFGSIGMFVPRGTYQFIVETMKKSGVGDRYLAFEALKKKLQEEGLFEESHKRKLPAYPKRIGVVTSPSGAVIHDIITTSASRFTADIILAPAMVQGEGAAETIVNAIGQLNEIGVDIIIVGRGGGSIEDLWPFNEEIVARAIYNSPTPIVSAVGHETDFTIADFVADVRAPTPTGAAAIILRDKNEIRAEIQSYSSRLERVMMMVLEQMKGSFKILDSKLSPQKAMGPLDIYALQLDDLSRRMDYSLEMKVREMRATFDILDSKLKPERALEDYRDLRTKVEVNLDRIRGYAVRALERGSDRFDNIADRPEMCIYSIIDDTKRTLESESKHLEGLSPYNVLDRGYSMISSSKGRTLVSINDLDIGDSVVINMRDGKALADIKDKETGK